MKGCAAAMALHNASIAETLRHVADLLEIEGANPFRIRAYRRAAQTVEEIRNALKDVNVVVQTLGLIAPNVQSFGAVRTR